MRIAVASGYFNPIHPGHINYFRLASRQADLLWVIVNNDHQAELKRGTKSFQNEMDRIEIVKAIKYVDEVFLAIDEDASVCNTVSYIYYEACARYGSGNIEMVFAKGGDRLSSEIPEADTCRKLGIELVDGLGLKTHNSSSLVK